MKKEILEKNLKRLENFIIYQDLKARFETLSPEGIVFFRQMYESDRFTLKEAVEFVRCLQREKENEEEKEMIF